MASVRRKNGRWEGRYRGPDNKLRAKTFDRKIDAEAWAQDGEVDQRKGTWIDPRSATTTFKDFAEQWLLTKRHRQSTADQVAMHMKNHIVAKWGRRPLGSIRRTEIEAWIIELGEGHGKQKALAPATVEVIFNYFRSVMLAAERDRLIVHNPASGVRAPKPESRRVVPLEPDEISALIEAVPQKHRGIVVLGAGAGLRRGEALAATNDPALSIDWARRQIFVDRQIVQTSKGIGFGPPKTAAGVRTVPLADEIVAELGAHVTKYDIEHGALLFERPEGGPVKRSTIGAAWEKAVRTSGVERANGVHFHDLRHGYASTLIRAGLNAKMIQTYLGHASIAETFDTYGHLFPADDEAGRAAISAVWSARGLEPALKVVSPGQRG